MKFFRITVVQMLILAFPLLCHAANKKDGILFKDVATDKPCRELRGYICGAEVYPDYDASDLPKNYGVKSVPGVIIPADAITGAKIIKQQLGKWENWQVEIIFTDEYGRRIKKYTANKKGKLMAIEIGGKIAAILPLASDLDNEITITSTKDRIEEIGNLIRTFYPQITREIQTQAPKSNRPLDRSR